MMPFRYISRKAREFFINSVLGVHDTPHRIALGVAIGVFIALTPTVGIQMLLTVAIAAALRANKVVGLPWAWITNPVTMVPIYYGEYLVGRLVMGWKGPGPSFTKAILDTPGWFEKFWAFFQATLSVFWPLWVGSIIVSAAFGVPTYFIIKWAVIEYRKIRHVQPDDGRPFPLADEANGETGKDTTNDSRPA